MANTKGREVTYNKALSAHYRRLETDPMYRMLEAMEDLRVDIIPGRGTEEEVVPEDKPEPQWNKRQWGIVDQLRLNQINIRNLIYSTLKENKAKYASKQKTNYSSIYSSIELQDEADTVSSVEETPQQ